MENRPASFSYVSHPNGDLETALHIAVRRSCRVTDPKIPNRRWDTLNLLLLFGADPRLKGRFTLFGKRLSGSARDFARASGNGAAVAAIDLYLK